MKTIYPAFAQGLNEILTDMTRIMEQHGMNVHTKVGMPFGIGCGLGKGEWNEIFSILGRVSVQHNEDIYLYKL